MTLSHNQEIEGMLKCSSLNLMFLKKGLCLYHTSAHSDCCLMLNKITQCDCLICCTLSFLIISMSLFSCICPVSAFCKCTVCVINNTFNFKIKCQYFSKFLWWFCHLFNLHLPSTLFSIYYHIWTPVIIFSSMREEAVLLILHATWPTLHTTLMF